MTEHEHDRPLTRRELRERERAAAGESGHETSEAAVDSQASAAEVASHEEFDIEIDPLNPDGSQRTRREMRQLREEAVAALIAQREAAKEDSSAPAETVGEESAASEGAADESVADSVVESTAESEQALPDFTALMSESFAASAAAMEHDSTDDGSGAEVEAEVEAAQSDDAVETDDYGPPTEAYSLDELLEASEPVHPTGSADTISALFGDDGDVAEASEAGKPDFVEPNEAEPNAVESNAVADSHVDPGGLQDEAGVTTGEEIVGLGAGADVADDVDEPVLDVEPLEDSDQPEGAIQPEGAPIVDGIFYQVEEGTPADVEDGAGKSGDSLDGAHSLKDEGDVPEDTERAPELRTDTSAYSFPDIQPPEEWRSVFDDPGHAEAIVTPDSSGDFDDLISRAVAQEGSTEGGGDSALILPTHPGDTGGLTGPLGTTGELFITGSIELPKSLGETGGHSAIQDSAGLDLFLTGEQTGAIDSGNESDSGPVPALRAVSARRRPEVPVIAEPTKDKSKLPVVLALAGGTLIVLLAGAVIYAATQGLFG